MLTENLREQRSVKLRWNSIISLSLLHNRCYQRQEITHREESSDSEGTMRYANGSSKWHTPAYYIWHCRLVARTPPSQGGEHGIETL